MFINDLYFVFNNNNNMSNCCRREWTWNGGEAHRGCTAGRPKRQCRCRAKSINPVEQTHRQYMSNHVHLPIVYTKITFNYNLHSAAPTPSTHPSGISTAATSVTPRSVASRLNCDAAFLVSRTSTRIPSDEMCFFNSGLRGTLFSPVPMISRSIKKS